MCNPTRKEATFSVGSKIGEGFGEWSEAFLARKVGWSKKSIKNPFFNMLRFVKANFKNRFDYSPRIIKHILHPFEYWS